MTVGGWIASRVPAPPAPLASRIAESLGTGAHADRAASASACLDAAVALLEQVLSAGDAGRDSALDLLTADALVTYAFEAAAADIARLDERSAEAMVRLASLAGRGE